MQKVALFEIKANDYPIMILINVSPKEYYKHYWNYSCMKNHKRLRKDSPRMDFENYAFRILSLLQHDDSSNSA